MKRFFDLGEMGIDRWMNEVGLSPVSITYGNLYDPEKFDLIPKKEFIDMEIRRVEQELESIDRAIDSAMKYYESRKQRLVEEKEKLLKQKKKV